MFLLKGFPPLAFAKSGYLENNKLDFWYKTDAPVKSCANNSWIVKRTCNKSNSTWMAAGGVLWDPWAEGPSNQRLSSSINK